MKQIIPIRREILSYENASKKENSFNVECMIFYLVQAKD